MNPVCSLLHATLGRPEKALATMRLWAERATNPAAIEYVIAYEKSDAATEAALDAYLPTAELPWFQGGVPVVRGDFGGSAPAWDAAARVSSGHLLVQVSDDFAPPVHWDLALLGRLPMGWEQERIVIAVNDGLRRDRLMCHAICTAVYADHKGEFLHAGYKSMFSDNDFTISAYRHQDRGECKVIEARDLLFEHQHHCKTGESEDATYAWTNRPEAYAHGKRLFEERHPHAFGREARLWL